MFFQKAKEDIAAVREHDPAARSALEIYFLYPGVRALRIGETIAPGVPWTETLLDPANPGAPHLALALKSGNFGGEDFFMQALGLLANAN